MKENTSVTKKEPVSPPPGAALLPAVDIVEDALGITVCADLPGVPKDKLSIRLEADSLIIEGDIVLNTPQDMQSTYAEMRLPRYRRTFTLSGEMDSENISAEFENGVLKLHIPKAKHVQPRKIQVKVA